jgi:hypothetical protein
LISSTQIVPLRALRFLAPLRSSLTIDDRSLTQSCKFRRGAKKRPFGEKKERSTQRYEAA